MTYLSVKALRYYHEVGLLEPALIDPSTGYRHYASNQVATAQAIRRFRDLDMPINEVRQVLQAPDLAARNRAILTHLERMHQQLEQTQATVASLQALLTDDPHPPAHVEIRRIPATRAIVARTTVAFADCGAWLAPALTGLHAEAGAAGLAIAGADGALYPDEFFETGLGEVTAFVPVGGDASEIVEFPAVTVAVLLHDGPFADLDRAYGALGIVVAERSIGGPGPIREHYLTDTSTEVCWPVTTAAT
jgi:DNA-binding transcriptional MerR regulator/effector-binding domain-containing protein